MKKIIFPTDFSDLAANAMEYALSLAKAENCDLLVFHVYHLPIQVPTEMPGAGTAPEESTAAMENLKTQIGEMDFGDVNVRYNMVPGFAVDGVLATAEQEDADLIVMGTSGATGAGNWLLGSIAEEVIEKSPIPVLSIPSDAKFRPIDRIMYAADVREEDFSVIKQLKGLVQHLNAELDIVHVQTKNHQVSDEEFERFQYQVCLDFDYGGLRFDIFEADDVLDGIESWVKEKNIDVLAMLTHKRNFFQKIFDRSLTRRMAFHGHIPLLAFKG